MEVKLEIRGPSDQGEVMVRGRTLAGKEEPRDCEVLAGHSL